MYQTVGLNKFRNAFEGHERTNFSYEGLEVLFNYIEENYGDSVELDVIALCCEYCEMTYVEVFNTYDDITDEDLTDFEEDELLDIATEYLDNHTIICGVTNQGSIVFAQF